MNSGQCFNYKWSENLNNVSNMNHKKILQTTGKSVHFFKYKPYEHWKMFQIQGA